MRFGPLPARCGPPRPVIHDRPRDVRMNRHDYFELLFLYSGEAVLQIQERYFTLRERDLSRYRQYALSSNDRVSPNRSAGRCPLLSPDQYVPMTSAARTWNNLMPFMIQDSTFPHLVALVRAFCRISIDRNAFACGDILEVQSSVRQSLSEDDSRLTRKGL